MFVFLWRFYVCVFMAFLCLCFYGVFMFVFLWRFYVCVFLWRFYV